MFWGISISPKTKYLKEVWSKAEICGCFHAQIYLTTVDFLQLLISFDSLFLTTLISYDSWFLTTVDFLQRWFLTTLISYNVDFLQLLIFSIWLFLLFQLRRKPEFGRFTAPPKINKFYNIDHWSQNLSQSSSFSAGSARIHSFYYLVWTDDTVLDKIKI